MEYQQNQTKSVSSSTYSSEYYNAYNLKKFETFPIKLRREKGFVKPRPISGDNALFASSANKSAKVRRNHTVLAVPSGQQFNASSLNRDNSFSSHSSSGSNQGGLQGPKKEYTHLEDIFHVNPKKRFEKKYRSMIKKKFEKTFGEK